jgi:hypothetical protein
MEASTRGHLVHDAAKRPHVALNSQGVSAVIYIPVILRYRHPPSHGTLSLYPLP